LPRRQGIKGNQAQVLGGLTIVREELLITYQEIATRANLGVGASFS